MRKYCIHVTKRKEKDVDDRRAFNRASFPLNVIAHVIEVFSTQKIHHTCSIGYIYVVRSTLIQIHSFIYVNEQL